MSEGEREQEPEIVDFGDERPHQVRLEGGDSSSDSFCYPS
jgi:selenium-binding protein 1